MRTVGVTDQGQLQTVASLADRLSFTATPGQLLQAVETAYRDLGIEPTTVNAETRQVGNLGFVRRRQLGAAPLSRYFECGNNFTGLRADDDRLTIKMLSVISDAGGGTSEVRTTLSAVAKPMDGSSTLPADCSSTGRLEQNLYDAVAKRLAAR